MSLFIDSKFLANIVKMSQNKEKNTIIDSLGKSMLQQK